MDKSKTAHTNKHYQTIHIEDKNKGGGVSKCARSGRAGQEKKDADMENFEKEKESCLLLMLERQRRRIHCEG